MEENFGPEDDFSPEEFDGKADYDRYEEREIFLDSLEDQYPDPYEDVGEIDYEWDITGDNMSPGEMD